jgi:hypothetical protein
VRCSGEEAAYAATGERAPEFSGDEEGKCSVWCEELRCAFDEERGEVDLRGESCAGVCIGGAFVPGRVAERGEHLAERASERRRDVVEADPGRVAEDDGEAVGVSDGWEVGGEGEGERCALGD